MFTVLKNVGNFSGSNYGAIGLLLGALALQIGGLDHWADAIRPSFVAGALAAFAAVLQGIGSKRPSDPNDTVSVPR